MISKLLMQHPRHVLFHLQRLDAEDSLLEFVRQAWDVLEPQTPFKCNWVLETMAAHLEAVSRGEIRRLLVNVPPGFTKSMLVNVFWPAWEWGPRANPHLRYISASYETGLATRDMLRCRDLIESEWYQERWPSQFKKDQNQKTYYENVSRGFRLASSVGGRLTGYRGDRIIIDDPHDVNRAESETERNTARRWFTETLPTRLNNQDESVMVMIMQRLHVEDLSGLVISKLYKQWTHLFLPMHYSQEHTSYTTVPSGLEPKKVRREKEEHNPLPSFIEDENGILMYPQDPRTVEGELAWPERFSPKAVEELEEALRSGDGGEYAVTGQLEQRPVHREGGLFKRGDFRYLDHMPENFRWVRGWDLAGSTRKRSPYTAGVLMGIGKLGDRQVIVIADSTRFRKEAGEVKGECLAVAKGDGRLITQSFPQDPGQAGKSQKADYASSMQGHHLHFSPETGSKEVRANPLASQTSVGNVYLVRGAWNSAFLGEIALFPGSDYKDQVDAASRAYAYLVTQRRGRIATTPGWTK